MGKGCEACDQGRESCPTPFACETSEGVESEMRRDLLEVFVYMGVAVFCFVVIVCL